MAERVRRRATVRIATSAFTHPQPPPGSHIATELPSVVRASRNHREVHRIPDFGHTPDAVNHNERVLVAFKSAHGFRGRVRFDTLGVL